MWNENDITVERWEQELQAANRWGQHGRERAQNEIEVVRQYKNNISRFTPTANRIISQISWLEICHWNFEQDFMTLCECIGNMTPLEDPIGHMNRFSENRWRKIWSYYLACRLWLSQGDYNGYNSMLKICDPDNEIKIKVFFMLGEKTLLKQLYVERFCLCIDFWLDGGSTTETSINSPNKSPSDLLEEKINKLDPGNLILKAMQNEGMGKLNPCHHKLFRRYEIILSSIGAGKWRGTMSEKGIDGFEIADMLEKYLMPVESWLNKSENRHSAPDLGIFDKIQTALGQHDMTKCFLSVFLLSLMRSQQLAAKKIAQENLKKKNMQI